MEKKDSHSKDLIFFSNKEKTNHLPTTYLAHCPLLQLSSPPSLQSSSPPCRFNRGCQRRPPWNCRRPRLVFYSTFPSGLIPVPLLLLPSPTHSPCRLISLLLAIHHLPTLALQARFLGSPACHPYSSLPSLSDLIFPSLALSYPSFPITPPSPPSFSHVDSYCRYIATLQTLQQASLCLAFILTVLGQTQLNWPESFHQLAQPTAYS